MNDEISPNEWAARYYAKACGVTMERARDMVILRCLAYGDVAVFSYFVLAGHRPSDEVLRSIAFMTTEGSPPDSVVQRLPYALKAVPRRRSKAGKRADPIVAIRDEAIALNVKNRMERGLSRDAAVSEVAEMISQKSDMKKGRSRKWETVLKSYKSHAKKIG